MSTATLSAKFRFTVLKEVREALGLKPRQQLAFINTGTGMHLVGQPAIADLVGIARGANTDGLRDREDRLARLPPAKVRRKPGKT